MDWCKTSQSASKFGNSLIPSIWPQILGWGDNWALPLVSLLTNHKIMLSLFSKPGKSSHYFYVPQAANPHSLHNQSISVCTSRMEPVIYNPYDNWEDYQLQSFLYLVWFRWNQVPHEDTLDLIKDQHDVWHMEGTQDSGFFPSLQQVRKKLGWDSHKMMVVPIHTGILKASFLAFVPDRAFFLRHFWRRAREGILIGWEERGCISSRRFTGVPSF